MKLWINVHEDPRYLICTVTGKWVTDELKKFIDQVYSKATTLGYHKILADMSSVLGPPPEMDRFFIGEYVASALRGIKVAIVYKKIYANRFFEDTAVNRGASVKVFPDRESALQWLMSD